LLELRLNKVYGDNMMIKGNGVNIESEPRRYHHGDLRSALVAAGLELLASRAADEMSLREVARAVGVSATAVYRHFPDKQALLFELCEHGAQQLCESQRIAMAGKTPKTALEASGRAYILFALANPGLYRLMMATKPSIKYIDAQDSAMDNAMQLLKDCVANVLPTNATAMEHEVAALHAWSLVHGISMLMLDELVAPDGKVIDALLEIPLNFV
jgi:AcrR family transcriptional regulator